MQVASPSLVRFLQVGDRALLEPSTPAAARARSCAERGVREFLSGTFEQFPLAPPTRSYYHSCVAKPRASLLGATDCENLYSGS